ncbi:MAG: aminopeptidase P family protein [Oscillospiraceae bacterium]|nr:aminopeptidase P family protein [Oscillospiraceae bacterium]
MSNITRIRQQLSNYKCDAILILNQVNRLFATGFSSSAGCVLITEDNAWFFTDSRYIEAAGNAIKDANVKLVAKDEKIAESVKKIIDENKIASIGFEEVYVSYACKKDWDKKLGIKMVPAHSLINDLRNIKSEFDLDKIIKIQRISEKVFNEILPIISTDMTEKDLAAEIIYRSLKSGVDDKAFDPIVVSGPNSSRPHGVPGNEKIGKGFLTIDFGLKLDGWCSDTTRTLCIGKPDDEMVNIYDTVLSAQEAGIKEVRAGAKGVDIDTAARRIIEDAGYGEYFGHGFGHSLGLEVHESLSASRLSKDTIPAGAVMSAEPGIYLPGKYGVRIEDTLFVTENGSQNITTLPKNLTVL